MEYENAKVKEINTFLFIGLNSLTSVSFPVCTSIGYAAFASVSFPACTNIGVGAFSECTSLTSVNFPACTSIGVSAFKDCSSLTSVNFPACTSIGNYVFDYCSSLTSLYFTGSRVPSAPYGIDVRSTATIYVAPSMVDAFKNATYWSNFASRIVAYTE